MAAPPEASKGAAGKLGVLSRDGDDVDIKPLHEEVYLPLAVIPVVRLHHDARLDERGCGESTRGVELEGRDQARSGRLSPKDGDDGRRVENHGRQVGRPSSS